MTTSITTNEMIQKVKGFIVRRSFNAGFYGSFEMLSDKAETIIGMVALGNFGLATEIATTCEKFKRVSEKQAYWIAKTAVENNMIEDVTFLFED